MSLESRIIAPADLRDFAKSLGWNQFTDAIRDGLYVLRNPRYERRELIFPTNSDAPDYTDAIALTLNKLAEIQNVSVAYILSSLNEQYDDTVRFRVVDLRNEENYIPLNYAVSAINGARDMFLSAACTVLKPQIHHPRLSRSEAQQLIDKSKFRHTEKGSFVMKVSAPVKALEIQGNLYDSSMPFVRQTTVVINRSINKLVAAIQTDALDALVDEEKNSETPEISSNICKSIISFREIHDDFDLILDFKWAAVVPINSPTGFQSSIRIQKEYFSRIDDVRRELRTIEEQALEEVFMASIEHLAGDIGSDGLRSGEVVLNLYKDEEIIRAKAILESALYSKADQSHMTPGSYIRVKGILLAGNQPRYLTQISSFEIVE